MYNATPLQFSTRKTIGLAPIPLHYWGGVGAIFPAHGEGGCLYAVNYMHDGEKDWYSWTNVKRYLEIALGLGFTKEEAEGRDVFIDPNILLVCLESCTTPLFNS